MIVVVVDASVASQILIDHMQIVEANNPNN
jgi:hypothetical protein